jgi:hypothetical protein
MNNTVIATNTKNESRSIEVHNHPSIRPNQHHSSAFLAVQLCLCCDGFFSKLADNDRRIGELGHTKNLIVLKCEAELVLVYPRESMSGPSISGGLERYVNSPFHAL